MWSTVRDGSEHCLSFLRDATCRFCLFIIICYNSYFLITNMPLISKYQPARCFSLGEHGGLYVHCLSAKCIVDVSANSIFKVEMMKCGLKNKSQACQHLYIEMHISACCWISQFYSSKWALMVLQQPVFLWGWFSTRLWHRAVKSLLRINLQGWKIKPTNCQKLQFLQWLH